MREDSRRWPNERIPLFPVLLILLGVIFLLDNLGFVSHALGRWWPLLLIVAGIVWYVNSRKE